MNPTAAFRTSRYSEHACAATSSRLGTDPSKPPQSYPSFPPLPQINILITDQRGSGLRFQSISLKRFAILLWVQARCQTLLPWLGAPHKQIKKNSPYRDGWMQFLVSGINYDLRKEAGLVWVAWPSQRDYPDRENEAASGIGNAWLGTSSLSSSSPAAHLS